MNLIVDSNLVNQISNFACLTVGIFTWNANSENRNWMLNWRSTHEDDTIISTFVGKYFTTQVAPEYLQTR